MWKATDNAPPTDAVLHQAGLGFQQLPDAVQREVSVQVEMYKTGQTPRRAALRPPKDVMRAVELSRSATATPLHLPRHHSRSSSRNRVQEEGGSGSGLVKFSPRSTLVEAERRLVELAVADLDKRSHSKPNPKPKPIPVAAFPSTGSGTGIGISSDSNSSQTHSSPPPPPSNATATPPSAYMSLNRKYVDVFNNPDVLK